MDYEECLKIAYNILNGYHLTADILTETTTYSDKLARQIAEEIFNAFQFGIKWGNEGLNVQVS